MSNEHPVPRVHEEMVHRLIADARPTRALGSPLARTVPWVVLEGVTMLLAIAVGLRHSVVEAFASRRLAYEVAGLLVVAAWLAWLALRATIPGEGLSRWLRRTAFVLAGSLVASLGIGSIGDDAADGVGLIVLMRCWAATAGFAVIPWMMLNSAQRRGAVFDAATAWGLASAAALLLAAAAVRITCPIDEHGHLLMSHSVPVLVGTALAMWAGAKWGEREQSSAGHH